MTKKAYIDVGHNIYDEHHLSLWAYGTDGVGCWEYGAGYGKIYIIAIIRLVRNARRMRGFWGAFWNAIIRLDFHKD